QLFIDARLIIKPFHVAERDELTQITVALLIHRQEDKMVIVFLRPLIDAFFFEAAGGRDVNLASDDRLHAVAHRFPIEFDGSEHVPMIVMATAGCFNDFMRSNSLSTLLAPSSKLYSV